MASSLAKLCLFLFAAWLHSSPNCINFIKIAKWQNDLCWKKPKCISIYFMKKWSINILHRWLLCLGYHFVFLVNKMDKKRFLCLSSSRNCRWLVRAPESVEKFNYKSYNEFHSLLINHRKTSLCHDAATESLIINFLPANSQITTILATITMTITS